MVRCNKKKNGRTYLVGKVDPHVGQISTTKYVLIDVTIQEGSILIRKKEFPSSIFTKKWDLKKNVQKQEEKKEQTCAIGPAACQLWV